MSPPFDGYPGRKRSVVSSAPPFRRKLLFEALEQRILTCVRIVLAMLLGTSACLLPVPVYSQDAIVKAEELIRIQWIPFSRMATFEQQYPEEAMDYTAWLILRALDTSSAWGPKNRAWNLYRVNLRYDIEVVFRRRWQTASGTIRSLSENPDTSLAKFYADTLSVEQMEQMLTFYRTDAGKKYLQYLQDIRRTYFRGSLELDRIAIDPDLGVPGDSASERRRAWLRQKNISLDPPPVGYDFHIKAAQGIFAGVDAMDLVFALVAGAPPGGEAYARLDRAMTETEREEVSRFLSSAPFAKERQARRNWSEAIGRQKSALPLFIGSVAGMVELLSNWKKTRAMPMALPRSISQIDPATLQALAEYSLLRIEDEGTAVALKSCMPNIADASIKNLARGRDGRSYREVMSLITMLDSKYMIATRREFVACIPTTAPGYPVPALSSFLDTIRIGGMDDAEAARWHQAIAQEVGANGASESLVIMDNGSALEISYAVNVRAPHSMVYLSRFFPAGTYDPSRYRTVMKSGNYKGISVMSRVGADGVQRREKSLITTPDDIRQYEQRNKRTTPAPDPRADNPGKGGQAWIVA